MTFVSQVREVLPFVLEIFILCLIGTEFFFNSHSTVERIINIVYILLISQAMLESEITRPFHFPQLPS